IMAAGALEGVRSLGLTVPGDLSVVGYDDVFWAALTNPPLTTVRQAGGAIARAAVRTALSGGGEGSRRPARTEGVRRPQLAGRGPGRRRRREPPGRTHRGRGATAAGGARLDGRRPGRRRELSSRSGRSVSAAAMATMGG